MIVYRPSNFNNIKSRSCQQFASEDEDDPSFSSQELGGGGNSKGIKIDEAGGGFEFIFSNIDDMIDFTDDSK